MPVFKTNPTLRIIKIDVYSNPEESQEGIIEKIFNVIEQKYEVNVISENNIELVSSVNKCSCTVRSVSNFVVIKSMFDSEPESALKRDMVENISLFTFSDIIQDSLPLLHSTSFTIFNPKSKDKEHTASLLYQISEQLSMAIDGVGVVRGSLLSIFTSIIDEKPYNQYIFLSSIETDNTDDNRLQYIVNELEHLAVYTTELVELHNRSEKFVSILEVGEREITERVEGYLWKLMSPEPVKVDTLESWLSYIMERDSTISAMIGNLSINHMEAKSIEAKINHVFMKLNEEDFEDYPQNKELVIEQVNRFVRGFKRNIVRSQAIKSRLSTTMEEVRTYLSLQQQKLAIEEQQSSKEQLVRLVNLQELFHKVEIFIVAVYITEMAHLIFEAIAHDSASLYTAIFIPIALVLAIGISRILHHE